MAFKCGVLGKSNIAFSQSIFSSFVTAQKVNTPPDVFIVHFTFSRTQLSGFQVITSAISLDISKRFPLY